jgi:hypothetical protein
VRSSLVETLSLTLSPEKYIKCGVYFLEKKPCHEIFRRLMTSFACWDFKDGVISLFLYEEKIKMDRCIIAVKWDRDHENMEKDRIQPKKIRYTLKLLSTVIESRLKQFFETRITLGS